MRRGAPPLQAGTGPGKGTSLLEPYTDKTLEDIRYLSQAIGGRGSCTPAEREAAQYVAQKMELLGVQDVRLEAYRGAPSTYRSYALAIDALPPDAGDAMHWHQMSDTGDKLNPECLSAAHALTWHVLQGLGQA